MGPEQMQSLINAINKRPKHVWDIRTTPWKDGVDIQEKYNRAVE